MRLIQRDGMLPFVVYDSCLRLMSSMRSGRSTLWILVLAGISGAARASGDAESSPGDLWVLTTGAEVDGDGGYLLDASAAFSRNRHATFTLHAGHSDTATVADRLSATTVGLDYERRFRNWGVNFFASYWKDPDLVAATEYGGSVFFASGGWWLSSSVQARSSRFNDFTVNGTIPRPNQPPLAVAGEAGCDLDDLGIGARMSFDGERWGGYLSGKSYNYGDFNCRFSSLTVGGIHVPQERLRALAPNFLRLLTLRATAAGLFDLRQNTVFLDSSLAAGVSLVGVKRIFAVDYLRAKESLDGLISNTLTVSVTFQLSQRADLEVHVGVYDAEQTDTLGFAGVTFIAYLGGAHTH
jgi:hypothetical protein